MNFPNPELPIDPPAPARDALDCGVTINDWANADPEGFDAALESAFESDWRAMLNDLCWENAHSSATKGTVRQKMQELLVREVKERRQWALDFMRRGEE